MLVFDLSLNYILSVVVATIVGLVTGFVLFNIVFKRQYEEATGITTPEGKTFLQPDPPYLVSSVVLLFIVASVIGWVLNNVGATDLLDAVIIGVLLWVLMVWIMFGAVAFEKFFTVKAFSIRALNILIQTVLISLTIKIVGDMMLIA